MEIIGIGLIAFLLFAIAGIVIVFLVIRAIQNSLRRIANQAMNRVLDVGERELVRGIHKVEEVIGDEMVKQDPKRMATEVMKLAEQRKGELTVSQVMSGLDVSQSLALRTLEEAMKKGLCTVQDANGQKIYIFPSFKKKKAVRVCEYCGGSYDEAAGSAMTNCPSCGAKLKISTVLE